MKFGGRVGSVYWRDLAGFGGIWRDLAGFGGIWVKFGCVGEIVMRKSVEVMHSL